MMAEVKSSQRDPREAGARPPFPEKKQQHPGSDRDLQPRADHGEQSYRGANRLTGKKALITGADSGIGRAVALAFAREGADVVISYLDEDQDAQETERLVREAGRKAVRIPGDIRDEGHCKKLVDTAFSELGGLDILVNNAAFQMCQEKIEDFSSEQFERVFRTNVFALFYLCKAALPRMKAGSSIINTTSIEAYNPDEILLDYASTKATIVSLTKSLAKLGSKQGVRVNAVAPGPVWTPLIPATMPADQVKSFGSDTLFKRPAQPAELAPIYVLLAAPEASYITGEVYGVTGGKSPF